MFAANSVVLLRFAHIARQNSLFQFGCWALDFIFLLGGFLRVAATFQMNFHTNNALAMLELEAVRLLERNEIWLNPLQIVAWVARHPDSQRPIFLLQAMCLDWRLARDGTTIFDGSSGARGKCG